MNMAEGDTLISVDYEVFGKVQGVFFRKYTQIPMTFKGLKSYKACSLTTVELHYKSITEKYLENLQIYGNYIIHFFVNPRPKAESKRLGLVGWVQNTDQGTVQGQLQGPISKVRHMQEWLETKGSPKSHIDRANFNNEKVILKLDYSDFQIVK